MRRGGRAGAIVACGSKKARRLSAALAWVKWE
jgi:hypothetical protein